MVMRVAFLIPDLNDGGAQVQCLRLAESFHAFAQIDVLLIYIHDGVHSGRLDGSTVKHRKIDSRSNFDPVNLIRIHRVLKEYDPDILFTWLHVSDIYGYVLKILRPRWAWLIGERNSAYPRKLRFILREKLGPAADAIVCNSVAGRRYWQRLGARSPIHVVPNIVALPAGVRPAGARRGVVFVGRLEDQKNVLVLAEAFALAARAHPDVDFRIVGQGAHRAAIEAIVEAAGVGDRVKLLGFRQDAADLIGGARLFVTISHHEGTPNALLEAIAAGTRAVASAIPEHLDLLGEDYPFLTPDGAGAAEVADAIGRALDAPDDPGDYAAARAAMGGMSAEAVAARYAAVFESMLD